MKTEEKLQISEEYAQFASSRRYHLKGYHNNPFNYGLFLIWLENKHPEQKQNAPEIHDFICRYMVKEN